LSLANFQDYLNYGTTELCRDKGLLYVPAAFYFAGKLTNIHGIMTQNPLYTAAAYAAKGARRRAKNSW
jgi:hypothetical protein